MFLVEESEGLKISFQDLENTVEGGMEANIMMMIGDFHSQTLHKKSFSIIHSTNSCPQKRTGVPNYRGIQWIRGWHSQGALLCLPVNTTVPMATTSCTRDPLVHTPNRGYHSLFMIIKFICCCRNSNSWRMWQKP